MTGVKDRYELVDTTADIGVRAFGKTISELFESCAMAMFDINTDISKVEQKGELKIEMTAEDREMLLINFLNQLLYFKDTDSLVFSSCRVDEVSEKGGLYKIIATVAGEVFDAKRHEIQKDVKAATYHMVEINEEKGYAVVIFDI